MNKKFIFSIISLCILLMVIGFTYGYYSTSNKISKKPKDNVTDFEIQTNITGDERKISQVIDSETKITYNTKYLDCEYEKSETRKPENIMINMTKDDFRSYIKKNGLAWQVDKFSSEEVSITINNQGECTNHDVIDHYIIGIKNNYIAIFYVNVNGEYIKTEKLTDTPIETLREEDLEDLREGIKVNSEEEIDSIIENFIS